MSKIVSTLSLVVAIAIAGCSSSSMRTNEGGIVGSGTKIDCQSQPKHPSCQQTTQ